MCAAKVLRARAGRWEPQTKMSTRELRRLTSRELHALLDELFPHGFASADVLAEIAPEGWKQSPLLACFHPSVEQLFEERVMFRRNLEEFGQIRRNRKGETMTSEPNQQSTLVGLCRWDVFSDIDACCKDLDVWKDRPHAMSPSSEDPGSGSTPPPFRVVK